MAATSFFGSLISKLLAGDEEESPKQVSSREVGSKTGFAKETTRRKLPAAIADLINPAASQASRLMTDPAAGLAPIRQASRNSINRQYAAAPQGIADKLLAFGGSKSGKFGKALRASEMARYGDLTDLDGQIAELILAQRDKGSDLATKLLGLDFGSDRSSSSSERSAGAGRSITGDVDDVIPEDELTLEDARAIGSAVSGAGQTRPKYNLRSMYGAVPGSGEASSGEDLFGIGDSDDQALVRKHLGDEVADGELRTEDLYRQPAGADVEEVQLDRMLRDAGIDGDAAERVRSAIAEEKKKQPRDERTGQPARGGGQRDRDKRPRRSGGRNEPRDEERRRMRGRAEEELQRLLRRMAAGAPASAYGAR